jgi:hypothetical protein
MKDQSGNEVLLAGFGLEELAAALIMLVPTCMTLGHESIQSTLGYVHGEPGGTAAFIKDMFTLTPSEIAVKWYGSEESALEMYAEAMGRALFADDPAA